MKPKTVGRVTDGLQGPEHAHLLCYGLPVGCPVLTGDGSLPVEFLSAGDRIITRNGGMTELLAITAITQSTRAIKITQGAFGSTGPDCDVVLPTDQPVLIRDWRARAFFGQSQAMTTAGHLVDDTFITDIGPRRLVLFRLSFDRPRVIYAGGLELGTDPVINRVRKAVA